jgi:hypothetical protein
MYRNDGVDIEVCLDSPENTNGYNVGYIEDGEWLKYTVLCDQEGTFAISARVACDSSGAVGLLVDEKQVATAVEVGSTGGYQNWKTISMGKVNLSKGNHTLKLIAEKGGFNLNFVEFK